jgi:hypothetical protein
MPSSYSLVAVLLCALGVDHAVVLCIPQQLIRCVYCLQEWKRFARSAQGGIKDAIVADLSRIAHSGTEDIFKANVKQFSKTWKEYKEVCENFKANWEPCGKHWAHFGRKEILHSQRNTSNHLERFQGIFKYDFWQEEQKQTFQL